MMWKTTPRLAAADERAVSVRALSDPRSVRRVVAGLPVRDLTRRRVEKALRALGFATSIHATLLDPKR
jgi:DNA-binding LacI/PurR family transcriptional regulator